jgi:hypothetical protein
MVRETLKDVDGQVVQVDEGESANVTATFADLDNATLAKASIDTMTATLVNAVDGTVINSVQDLDILDANNATVTAGGVLTMRLQPADNPIVSTTLAVNATESHYLTVAWTWNDGTTGRTGRQEWEILVRNLTTPVP